MPLKSLSTLEPHARQLAELSTAWADPFWDEASGLLWNPGYESTGSGAWQRSHLVRDTVWYVTGLFLRRQGSDVFRALHAIEAILDQQIDAPDQPYHGTFARSPEEALPQPGAREWRDYDPNWREFIITPLQILLAEYRDRCCPGASWSASTPPPAWRWPERWPARCAPPIPTSP